MGYSREAQGIYFSLEFEHRKVLTVQQDYSLRAKDYNAKKAKLKRLEEKVRDRNPDEFAFGMMGGRNQRQGKHGRGTSVGRDSAAARGLSHDAIKLLKTQDKGYLRTVGERVRREMERLERDVQLQNGMSEALGGKRGDEEEDQDDGEFDGFNDDIVDIDFGRPVEQKPRKTVFADDRNEQLALKKQRLHGDELTAEDSEEDQQTQSSRRPPNQLETERQALVEARRARKVRKRAADARENKLTSLRKQNAAIQAAEKELDWQRARMENSVGGTNKHGIKWKIRERKR